MITTLIHSLPLFISAFAVLGTCAIAFKDYGHSAKSRGAPERVGATSPAERAGPTSTTERAGTARSTGSTAGYPLAA